MTAADFAGSHGWSPATLRWWASRLNRASASDTPLRFARIVAAPRAAQLPPTEPPPIVVELHQARIVLPSGFDRADLYAVVELLGAEARRR